MNRYHCFLFDWILWIHWHLLALFLFSGIDLICGGNALMYGGVRCTVVGVRLIDFYDLLTSLWWWCTTLFVPFLRIFCSALLSRWLAAVSFPIQVILSGPVSDSPYTCLPFLWWNSLIHSFIQRLGVTMTRARPRRKPLTLWYYLAVCVRSTHSIAAIINNYYCHISVIATWFHLLHFDLILLSAHCSLSFK